MCENRQGRLGVQQGHNPTIPEHCSAMNNLHLKAYLLLLFAVRFSLLTIKFISASRPFRGRRGRRGRLVKMKKCPRRMTTSRTSTFKPRVRTPAEGTSPWPARLRSRPSWSTRSWCATSSRPRQGRAAGTTDSLGAWNLSWASWAKPNLQTTRLILKVLFKHILLFKKLLCKS